MALINFVIVVRPQPFQEGGTDNCREPVAGARGAAPRAEGRRLGRGGKVGLTVLKFDVTALAGLRLSAIAPLARTNVMRPASLVADIASLLSPRSSRTDGSRWATWCGEQGR